MQGAKVQEDPDVNFYDSLTFFLVLTRSLCEENACVDGDGFGHKFAFYLFWKGLGLATIVFVAYKLKHLML